MPITREDVIAGYREILAAPPPSEATMHELLQTYQSLATFRRRLRESAECQRVLYAASPLHTREKH
ncbi:hypothetical protein RFN29_15205 [Mesorhizobium sp. VK22B]|uniref:Uncharacterized protein n=1 Tax=Mesorhizobium captivum TaxID=3072319 RepID=A0ABU4Z135_9HYPH|nr:hypothetical protein [Mesorhizobium sp. VK22B]MDX8492925.1 hypothetical protein [Mesorhizobium sp. VK22B]